MDVRACAAAALLVTACASNTFAVSGDGGAENESGSDDAGTTGDAGEPRDDGNAGGTDAFCVTRFPNAAFCMDFEDGLRTAHQGKLTVTVPAPALDPAGTFDLTSVPNVKSGIGSLAARSAPAPTSETVHAELVKPYTTPTGVKRARSRFDLRVDSYTPANGSVNVVRVYLEGGGTSVTELNFIPNGKAQFLVRAPNIAGFIGHEFNLPVVGRFVAVDFDVALVGGGLTATLRFDDQLVAKIDATPVSITSPSATFTFGVEAPHNAPTQLVFDNFVFETE